MGVKNNQIDELKSELSELDVSMTEILEDAKLNNGGQLTDVARKKWDELDKKYDEKFNFLTATQSGNQRKENLNQGISGRQTQPDPIGSVPKHWGNGDGNGNHLANRAVLQTGGMANLSGRRYGDMFGDAKLKNLDKFDKFDDFLEAVQAKQKDDRLQKVEFLAGREGVASDGGFLVPEEFSSELLDASLENEIVRPRADLRPMTSQIKKVSGITHSDASGGQLFGGITARWLEEGGSGTDETPKTRQIQLTARKLFIYALTSNELLADGEDYENQLTGALIKATGWHLDDAYLNGTGGNQPLGVLNDPSLVVVAKEVGQALNSVVYTNIVKMFARMHPASAMNSVWIANQATIPQLMEMSVTIGTAGTHIPAMHETDTGFTLLTRPVVFTEKVPTLGTEGDISLIDFSQYIIGLRKEMTLDSSMHVGFQTDETAFRAIVRTDGQGKWDQAYIPKNGDTQSWCVTLADRS